MVYNSHHLALFADGLANKGIIVVRAPEPPDALYAARTKALRELAAEGFTQRLSELPGGGVLRAELNPKGMAEAERLGK